MFIKVSVNTSGNINIKQRNGQGINLVLVLLKVLRLRGRENIVTSSEIHGFKHELRTARYWTWLKRSSFKTKSNIPSNCFFCVYYTFWKFSCKTCMFHCASKSACQFWDAFFLCFKTCPDAQLFIWKYVRCLANQTHFHMKDCASACTWFET